MGKYFSMMAIRVVCFVLMVAIQPYGWYTWLFAIGAVLLPNFAVVIANGGGEAYEYQGSSYDLPTRVGKQVMEAVLNQ